MDNSYVHSVVHMDNSKEKKELLASIEKSWGADSLAGYIIKEHVNAYGENFVDIISSKLKIGITEQCWQNPGLKTIDWVYKIDPQIVGRWVEEKQISLKDLAYFTTKNFTDSSLIVMILPLLAESEFSSFWDGISTIAQAPDSVRKKIFPKMRPYTLYRYETEIGTKDLLLKNAVIERIDEYEILYLAFKNNWIPRRKLMSQLNKFTISKLIEYSYYNEYTTMSHSEKYYDLLVKKVNSNEDYEKVAEFFTCDCKKAKWLKKLKLEKGQYRNEAKKLEA